MFVHLPTTVCVLALCAPMALHAISLKHFSTKTAYEWAHNTSAYQTDELNTIQVTGKSCSAMHVAVLARHGARYPGDGDIEDISKLHEKIKSHLDAQSHPQLKNWTNPFPLEMESVLAPLGEHENEMFGKRVATKLESLFKKYKNLTYYEFFSSKKQRAEKSASSFHEGFVNATSVLMQDSSFDLNVNDKLVRFYDYCERYVKEVDENDSAIKEVDSFFKGQEVAQVKKRMAQKMAIDEKLLTPANVELIYTICAFETAIMTSSPSPWCALVEEQDLGILEYLGDLEEYYQNAYGYDVTLQQTCPLLSKIFTTMKKSMASDSKDSLTVGQFGFGHTSTVSPVMAALGLFKDAVPLKADNFHAQANRKFRTSRNLSFMANIMFVLYKCTPDSGAQVSGSNPPDHVAYYVKTLVNEQPVKLATCTDFHCPFETVVKHYSDLIEHCNFEKVCKVSGAVRSCLVNAPVLVLTLFAVFITRKCLF